MELNATGSVIIEGFISRFTAEGKWLISRHGKSIGSVDSLAEVTPLIAAHRERVIARLAHVEREAAERKAQEVADAAFECDVVDGWQPCAGNPHTGDLIGG